MILTLELPFRAASLSPVPALAVGKDPLRAYAARFGAAPCWFNEISPARARSLAQRALRLGVPLATADLIA